MPASNTKQKPTLLGVGFKGLVNVDEHLLTKNINCPVRQESAIR